MHNVSLYKRLMDQGAATLEGAAGSYSLVIAIADDDAANLGALCEADKAAITELDGAESKAERAAKIAELGAVIAQCPAPVEPKE